jgi:hypothetical protein
MNIIYIIFQLFIILYLSPVLPLFGGIKNILFFILFFISILIWIIDYRSISKYLNKPLFIFIVFGFYYTLISLISGFSLFYNIPFNSAYIFRHAYFLVFFLIGLPVFTESFNYGIFNYIVKAHPKNIFYVPFLFYGSSIFVVLIVLFSIKSYLIASILFMLGLIIDGFPPSSTQLALLQIIIILSVIFRFKINSKYLVLLIYPLLIGIYFIPDNILQIMSFYPNESWRLIFWVNSIKSTVDETFLFGHGFGTSYFDISLKNPSSFLQFFIPDNTLRQYPNPEVAQFILPQHNSFINIFYRLGFIGLSLFLGYLITISNKIKELNLPYQLHYILLTGMLIIGVNVGLESPKFLTEFILLFSLINYYIYKDSNLIID